MRWRTRRFLTRGLGALGAAGALLGLYLAIVPAEIDAVAWEPPPAPAVEATHAIEEVTRLGEGVLDGPEGLAVDDAGRLYVGCVDGWIHRINEDGQAERFAEVGGRPLGLAFDAEGRLVICNHPLGLQRVGRDGVVELLASEAGGQPIHFANALAIASSGVIYFTDSTDRYHLAGGYRPPHGAYDMLEARPRGRLLRYDPHRGAVDVVLDELHFPNGVALSENELTLDIAETFRCRILRHDLLGGETSVWLDNLPGFPDGLARVPSTGDLVIVMGVRRGAFGDWIQSHPWLKEQITKFPRILWEHPRAEAIVMFVNESGATRATLHDGAGELGLITSPLIHEGELYLGTLVDGHVFRLVLPAP